ncbi:hypothetical protein PV762_08170 [Mitsuaria sp. CC2]|uniref:hypothetical protein n=1 Tax=Mitsuaria sp. CC2 TaxID=3029186 RepID=UPI003B8C11C0
MHPSASFLSTASSTCSWGDDTRAILSSSRARASSVGQSAGEYGSAPLSPLAATSDAVLIDGALDVLGPRGAREAEQLARQLVIDSDLRWRRGSVVEGVDRFILDGERRGLPEALRAPAAQVIDQERDRHCPSGRLRAFIAALGRATVNLAHCGARNFASVALPTMVRQAVGRALDVALAESVSETARTWLSCGALAVPVLGQAVLLIRDEARGEATRYSRATRVALMALPAGACALGASTGTMLFAGTRFAEAVLYPLMRDSIQARWPMATAPDSGPTRSSLALAGLGYAINQLAVSRVFTAAPDVDLRARALLPGGIVLRGLSNWGGEALDLWTLLMLHHACRHGTATQVRMRTGQGDLPEAMRTMLHWDTTAARGCFVAGFNQLYDTLLDERTLERWIRPHFGAAAPVAADWLTELIVGSLTAPSYLFWTDPLNSHGVELQTLEEQRRGEPPPLQYAGNNAEPPVALDEHAGAVSLTAFRTPPRP